MRLFILLILITTVSQAQTHFKGKVIEEGGEAVSNVNVMVKDQNTIIAFAITDEAGEYAIEFNTSLDSVLVEVSKIGFLVARKMVNNKTQTLNFSLEAADYLMDEVTVKTPPIRRKGDTLSFSVEEFQRGTDRSIGDVLARIPGIYIDPGGEVFYQGISINKFYVEDLDLMGLGYKLINKNLPNTKVATIQIYENHQPVKMLDSLEVPENAAINLKLRNKFTYTGNFELGVGLKPLLWDLNLTPIIFIPNFQFLTSLESNNIGNNIIYPFSNFWFDGLGQQQDWLRVARPARPAFDNKRWMDNQSHGLSLNVTKKTESDFQFRLNSRLILDQQNHRGSNSQNYFLGDEVISYSEEINTHLRNNQASIKLLSENNSKKSYFKDELTFQVDWNADQGINDRLASSYDQLSHTHNINLSNDFRKAIKGRNKVYDFTSQMIFSHTNQDLKVGFVSADSSAGPLQIFSHQVFGANNHFKFTHKLNKRLSLNLQPGSRVEFSHIKTDLENYNDIENSKNDFKWNSIKTYISSGLSYDYGKLALNLNLPLAHYFIDYKPIGENSKNYSKIHVEPGLNALYKANMSLEFRGNVAYKNRLSRLGDIYDGYVMNSYLSLNNRQSDFRSTHSYNAGASVGYSEVFSGIAVSLRYNYTKNIQEKQIQTTIQQDGSIITQIGDKNAVFNMHNTNFRLSKYFLDLKTSADLGVTYSFSDADFWLNGEDRSYKMNTISPNLNISFAGIKASTITYYMSYAKLNNGISEPLSQWHQRVGAVFQIFENVIPKITLEHYRFSQTDKNDYFFADVAVSFKIPKSQHSISLSAINLFNLKEYSKLNISEYSTSVNSYRLRPRQFIIRTRFGF